MRQLCLFRNTYGKGKKYTTEILLFDDEHLKGLVKDIKVMRSYQLFGIIFPKSSGKLDMEECARGRKLNKSKIHAIRESMKQGGRGNN